MISINEHIRYLLTRIDCVVVPGLGAFIAQVEPAFYDAESQRYMPPCRRLGFNPRVSHDDGVLAHSIVRREGVGYDTARTFISNDVAMLRSRLDSCGIAVMPRLGTLARVNGLLEFTPAESNAVDARFMGLLSVPATETSAVSEPEVAENEGTSTLSVDFSRRRSLRWIRVAASVALLVGLGFALSTPVMVDRSGLNYASLSAPKIIRKAQPVKLPEAVAEQNRTLFCTMPDSAEATARIVVETAQAVPQIDTPTGCYKHYLVVASCENRKRADRYVRQHRADNLQVLEAEGRYRVYIKASNVEADVTVPRQEVSQRYPGAWIYTR